MLTTSNGCAVSARIAAATLRAVPHGTVLLSTITLKPSIVLPIALATARTAEWSDDPSSPGGVPTAMKRTSDALTDSARSVENVSRSSATLRLTSSSRPGS